MIRGLRLLIIPQVGRRPAIMLYSGRLQGWCGLWGGIGSGTRVEHWGEGGLWGGVAIWVRGGLWCRG